MIKDKIKELMAKINELTVPSTIFVAYSAKLTLFGTNIADAVAVFAIAGVYAYYMFLNKKRFEAEIALGAKLQHLEQQIASLHVAIKMGKTYEPQIKKAATDKRLF